MGRGKISFRMCEGESSDDMNIHKKAQMQIRSDITNPDGFSWMDGCYMWFNSEADKWFVENPFAGVNSLVRTTEAEASEAAEKSIDYSKPDWQERLKANGMASVAEGYFTNENDMFGPGRKEYLHVTKDENGLWQALKIVGDANVPRGKICFRMCAGEPADMSMPKKAQMLRGDLNKGWMDIDDPDGFSWMDGPTIAYDSTHDKWLVSIAGIGLIGTLSRTTEAEAKQAAETSIDYSKPDWRNAKA